jgi:hypothetical protein
LLIGLELRCCCHDGLTVAWGRLVFGAGGAEWRLECGGFGVWVVVTGGTGVGGCSRHL